MTEKEKKVKQKIKKVKKADIRKELDAMTQILVNVFKRHKALAKFLNVEYENGEYKKSTGNINEKKV